jgi:hypothetical protein
VHLDDYGSVEEAYLAGKRRLAATASKLTNQNAPQLLNGRVSLSLSKRPRTATSNMSKEEFLGAVQQTKEYIQVRHCCCVACVCAVCVARTAIRLACQVSGLALPIWSGRARSSPAPDQALSPPPGPSLPPSLLLSGLCSLGTSSSLC